MTTQIREKEVTMYYYYENPDYEANPISRSFIKVLSITENIFTALVIGVLSITTRACIPLYMDKAAREQNIHLSEDKAREARVLYIGPDVDPKLKTFILPFSPVGGASCHCSKLTSLDVSSFNTSNVTNMSYMFISCRGLSSLDVSSFNTSNVTNMGNMFSSCSGLTSLDLSNFDTSKVTNMKSMFQSCSKLTSLDLSSFNTSKVTTMSGMFESCSGLTSMDISSFDTSNVTTMSGMFYNCSGLTSLDLSSFNTSKVTNMDRMFYNCSKLVTIYASDLWSTASFTSSLHMFYNCASLVGGSRYSPTKVDKTMANTDSGYLTYKPTGT